MKEQYLRLRLRININYFYSNRGMQNSLPGNPSKRCSDLLMILFIDLPLGGSLFANDLTIY